VGRLVGIVSFFSFFLVKFSKDALVLTVLLGSSFGEGGYWVAGVMAVVGCAATVFHIAEGGGSKLNGTLLQVPTPGSRVRFSTGLVLGALPWPATTAHKLQFGAS